MDKNIEAGQLLLSRGLTVACAESCTGGLVTSLLTDVAGSSAYVKGSVVSYTNEIKRRVVGVREETLAAKSAVSEETAREMAEGVRRLIESDIGLSVTGNAGPEPSEGKPVGLVYVAVTDGNETAAKECHFNGTRLAIKRMAAEEALGLLIDFLKRK